MIQRLTNDYLSETMNAKRQFKVLKVKKKKSQPKILYLAKLSFKTEVEIKTFQDKQN